MAAQTTAAKYFTGERVSPSPSDRNCPGRAPDRRRDDDTVRLLRRPRRIADEQHVDPHAGAGTDRAEHQRAIRILTGAQIGIAHRVCEPKPGPRADRAADQGAVPYIVADLGLNGADRDDRTQGESGNEPGFHTSHRFHASHMILGRCTTTTGWSSRSWIDDSACCCRKPTRRITRVSSPSPWDLPD